jgi:hypothetical protein
MQMQTIAPYLYCTRTSMYVHMFCTEYLSRSVWSEFASQEFGIGYMFNVRYSSSEFV